MAELQQIHAIVTIEPDYGRSLTSPQLPGFVAIYDDESTLLKSYKLDLRQAGVRNAQVIGHVQMRTFCSRGGVEVVVRWADDEHKAERRLLAERVLRGVAATEGEILTEGYLADPAGVVTFVCCVSTDTLRWVVDQLNPRGDILVIATAVADNGIFGTQIATEGLGEGWPSLADLGIDLDMTVGDFLLKEAQRVADSEPLHFAV